MSGTDSDSSDPLGGTNPTGSTGGATRKCTKCTITSEATANVPTDKSRTKVGIGEHVFLTVDNGPATWTLSGVGRLVPSEGTLILFIAGDTAGTAAIEAVGPGCCCTITFTVVEPDSLTMEQEAGTHIRHHQDNPDCGFLARPYIHPDDVSFSNIDVRELNSACVADGYFKPMDGYKHQGQYQEFSPWFTVGECQPGKGSRVCAVDQIYSGCTGDPPEVGIMVFPIDWQYRVDDGVENTLPQFDQRHVVDATGQSTSSKAGESKTTSLTDPDSMW